MIFFFLNRLLAFYTSLIPDRAKKDVGHLLVNGVNTIVLAVEKDSDLSFM